MVPLAKCREPCSDRFKLSPTHMQRLSVISGDSRAQIGHARAAILNILKRREGVANLRAEITCFAAMPYIGTHYHDHLVQSVGEKIVKALDS